MGPLNAEPGGTENVIFTSPPRSSTWSIPNRWPPITT